MHAEKNSEMEHKPGTSYRDYKLDIKPQVDVKPFVQQPRDHRSNKHGSQCEHEEVEYEDEDAKLAVPIDQDQLIDDKEKRNLRFKTGVLMGVCSDEGIKNLTAMHEDDDEKTEQGGKQSFQSFFKGLSEKKRKNILEKIMNGDSGALSKDHKKKTSKKSIKDKKMLEDGCLFVNEEERHEGLADELLRLIRSMKQNFTIAGSVIKEDNETLTAMQSVAEANRSNLEREEKRLQHHASKSCFEWMMLLTVVLIIWSFVAMVVIMKVFPKRV